MSEIKEQLEIFLEYEKQPKYVPIRHECKNGRWYECQGQWKPSVTTFLNVLYKGIGFDIWLGNAVSYKDAMDYANERADLGSRIHTDIACLVRGYDIEIKERAEEEIKRLYEFIQFYKQKEPEIIQVEVPLWHPDIPFAGTADMIAGIDNEVYLLDWKTGELYDSHVYQISAYKYLIEKCLDIIIDKMALVKLGEYRGNEIPKIDDKPKYHFKEIEPVEYRILENIFELWALQNKNPEPILEAEYPASIRLIEIQEEENANDQS